MILAIRRGLLAGLRVDPECFFGTRRYIRKTINEKNGLIGYRPGNDLDIPALQETRKIGRMLSPDYRQLHRAVSVRQ